MIRKLLLMAALALPFLLKPVLMSVRTSKAASSEEGTKLTKDEIAMLMVQVGRLPVVQQDRKMDVIWENPGGSQTPRSDFLFSTGFAYLGNYKAQAHLGYAFENGRGVEKDLSDAYVWYCIALDNPIDDSSIKQKIRADRERVKKALLSVSPNKTEKELEDLVRAQKALRMEYLAEIRNTKF
jgi:hypothetical protein